VITVANALVTAPNKKKSRPDYCVVALYHVVSSFLMRPKIAKVYQRAIRMLLLNDLLQFLEENELKYWI